MSSAKQNPWLICAYYGVHSAMFPTAIFPLFWTRDIGMSVATMMSVQAFFSLSIALFEFPSGYIADRLGHRRALVLGSGAIVIGWLLYALARGLWSVLAAELVLGVGFSLISGADAALLYDSLREEGREHEFARWYGRMRSAAQISSGAAALLAGFLYARWSRLPFVMELVCWAVALGIALRFGETRRAQPRVEDHLGRMRAIVRDSLVRRADLRAVMLLGVAFALAAYLPTWLMALYATEAGAEVAWIGPMWAVASFTTALGAMVSERAGRRLGMTGTLLACLALVAAGYLGLALSHHALGFAFYFLLTFVRGLHMPLLHHEEQRLAPDDDRASCVSLRSFLFRIAFVLLGPVVGMGVDRYGHRPVLWVAGALMVALTLVALALFRARAAPPSCPVNSA
ncbi:MFS transporter (plasmid) [Sorangium sp. So ce119]|uniref:MFS transporter n=1 Tax=Sorangium sp. So ce119 TaxID=3133279 RepID=UPI003F6042BC